VFRELSDGRLLMMIRTHWGRFWEAFSDDGGLSWRTIRPSQIESTSAPGFLLRLRSGRLALVSNDRAGRANLLLALSEDDGKTWTKPVVLARQKDGQLSYPYCLERRPGELWVIAGFAFKHDSGISETGKDLSPLAADIGLLDTAGKRAFATHRSPSGLSSMTPAQKSGSNHQFIVFSQRMA